MMNMVEIAVSLIWFGLATATDLPLNNITVKFVPNSVTLQVDHVKEIAIVATLSKSADCCFSGHLITVNEQNNLKDFSINRNTFEICFSNTSVAINDFRLTPLKPVNHALITVNVSVDVGTDNRSSLEYCSPYFQHDVGTVIISAAHYSWLITFSAFIGWCYVAAWAVTSLPQFYTCISRKSVVGLDFNFTILGWLSFLCYTIFTTVLYWNENVKELYFKQHPHGVNPIQPNDVFMVLNSLLSYTGYLVMIVVLDRGNQRVSWSCYGICAVLLLVVLICLILAAVNVITWLVFIQNLAYIKLFSTTIKYIPQVWLNYRKKSTDGWNIWFPILDFTGGILSILQMFLISYNFNDWTQISGDLVKFGLGIIALIFDTIFFFQRFYLYPPGKSAADMETCDITPSVVSKQETR